jgi:glycosyltransferase involved in cell wall biosynthesis
MRSARWLVLPSIWYENFPRTLVEAYACGLPVIASRLGALPELVEHGVTGLLFEPGSAEDLARTLHWADTHPDDMARMGTQARARYDLLYTPQRNLDMLNRIYADAIAEEARDRA